MKKICMNVLIICFLTIFSVTLFYGCRRKVDLDSASLKITKIGKYAWEANFDKAARIEVKCFLFPQSPSLEETFQEMITLRDEAIIEAEKMKDNAPTIELRKSYEEEFLLRKEGKWPWRLVDSWPNWPIVVVNHVFTEEKENAKALIVCRHNSKSLDVVFTMHSNADTTYHDCLRVAREITQSLDKPNTNWNDLPLTNITLDEATQENLPEEFKKFFEDSVFIEQR